MYCLRSWRTPGEHTDLDLAGIATTRFNHTEGEALSRAVTGNPHSWLASLIAKGPKIWPAWFSTAKHPICALVPIVRVQSRKTVTATAVGSSTVRKAGLPIVNGGPFGAGIPSITVSAPKLIALPPPKVLLTATRRAQLRVKHGRQATSR